MKIKLTPPKPQRDDRITVIPYTTCVPYFLNSRGVLVHRVKHAFSMDRSWSPGPTQHAEYWCGNGGRGDFTDFMHEPPVDRIVCAECEARAVAAGEPASDELCGRHVHVGRVRPFKTCCGSDDN